MAWVQIHGGHRHASGRRGVHPTPLKIYGTRYASKITWIFSRNTFYWAELSEYSWSTTDISIASQCTENNWKKNTCFQSFIISTGTKPAWPLRLSQYYQYQACRRGGSRGSDEPPLKSLWSERTPLWSKWTPPPPSKKFSFLKKRPQF